MERRDAVQRDAAAAAAAADAATHATT